MGPKASTLSDQGAYEASGLPDDEILEKQLQAELQSQAGTQNVVAKVKSSKKRSHDLNETSGSAKKKQRKKVRLAQNLAGSNEISGGSELSLKKKKHRSNSLGTFGSNEPKGDAEHDRNPLGDITASENGPLVETVVGQQPVFTKFDNNSTASQNKHSAKSPFNNGQPAHSSQKQATPSSSRNEALMRTVLNACTGVKLSSSAVPEKTGSEFFKRSSPSPATKNKTASTVVKAEKIPRERREDATKYSLVPVLPQDYKIGPRSEKRRHHCPVDTCEKSFTRSTGLGQHMHRKHGGEILEDNGDGTFSIITEDEDAKRISRVSSMSNGETTGLVEKTQLPLNGHPLPRVRSRVERITDTAGGLLTVNCRKSLSESVDCNRLPTKMGLDIAHGNDNKQYESLSMKPEMLEATSSDDDSDEELLATTKRRNLLSSVSSVRVTSNIPTAAGKAIGLPRNEKIGLSSSDENVKAKSQLHQISSIAASPSFTREAHLKPRLSTLQLRTSTSETVCRDDSGSVMEEWEWSDGRIPDKAQLNDDLSRSINRSTLAFSSKYINEQKSVWVTNDVSFQTQHLRGGESHLWSDDKHYLRVCSVASGKVQIIMGNEIFSIGAHGMWRIPAGERCSASNRHYAEAVIHVSSVLEA